MKFKHQGYSLKAEVIRGLVSIEKLRFAVSVSRSTVTHHYQNDDGEKAEFDAARYGVAIQMQKWSWGTYMDRRLNALHRPDPTWEKVVGSVTNAVAEMVWFLAD